MTIFRCNGFVLVMLMVFRFLCFEGWGSIRTRGHTGPRLDRKGLQWIDSDQTRFQDGEVLTFNFCFAINCL